MQRFPELAERLRQPAYEPRPTYSGAQTNRQPFHHPQTSIGAGSAGHWLKMAGILSPLVIGELVKDPDKRWRWIRIMAVATALTAEGFHAHRVSQRRKEQQEQCR
jgi:hypothetical protein